MPRLTVHLLGGYRVELDGEAVYNLYSDKARALLAYLMVESHRPHRRETLAALLWPERPDAAARANLRQALSRLRQALLDHAPPYFLFVTPTDVQFNTASDYTLDVAELEAFSQPPADSPARGTQLLPEALCADFLAGFSVSDSEEFQAWVLGKQEQFHRQAIEVLEEQGSTFEESGDYEQAAAAARLELRLEPWLEEAHRRCMRALALTGRRDEALHQYEACRRALTAELGVEPAESTQALYADIRAGRLVAQRRVAPERPAGPTTGAAAWPHPSTLPAKPPGRLVAREDELEKLGHHLAAALAGETALLFVSGDPGSGKTALLEAFAAEALAEHPDLLAAGARCSPGGSADPFAPLRRLAEMLFGHPGNDLAWLPAGREQIDRLLAATGLALASLAGQGPNLIGTLVPASSLAARAGRSTRPGRVESEPKPDGSLSQGALSQGALFDQLICTLAAIAREQPLLLLFDDLQWVDDATAGFILRLGRELKGSRLLVVGAYRSTSVASGRRDPASGEAGRHPLAAVINELRRTKGEILVELDRADGRAFVEAYVDTEPNRLGAGFRDALYAQTGGHALFTVESLRNLQARGELFKDEAGRWVAHESLDWGALPARVEAAIAERIDRLPEPERRILSAASVQGDDFAGEMAAEVAGVPVPECLACLSGSLARQHQLVRAESFSRIEGVQSLAGGQRSLYRFTHHLFQKYLYDQLDPVERAQMHASVAAALDRQARDYPVGGDPTERERVGARLAWHYEAGGLPLQAARALLDAGREAMRLSAHREALERFDHGLALLEGEPRSKERAEIQRLLEVARLAPQRNLEGIGSASVQRGLLRAREVFAAPGDQSVGDAEGRPKRLLLLAETQRLMGGGKLGESLAAAERLRAEAQQYGEEDLLAAALLDLGITLHHMGRPVESDRHLNSAVELGMQERLAGARAATGVSAVPSGLGYSALNWWFFGYPVRAVARSAEAIGRAVECGDRFGQVMAAVTGAILLFLLGDGAGFAERCEQGQRVCMECGFGWWRAFFEVLLGRLPIAAAPNEEGIERMRKGIAEWQAMGMAMGMDLLTLVFADGCMAAAEQCVGRDDVRRNELLASALAALDSALGPAKFAWGQMHEAGLLRLRGELLLERDGLAASEEALDCFRRAMELGREQGALAWELRAAMSLVRLRQRQGEAYSRDLADARRCLRDTYGQFAEGFGFPDLKDAVALMRETG